jgi:hypothetical protein
MPSASLDRRIRHAGMSEPAKETPHLSSQPHERGAEFKLPSQFVHLFVACVRGFPHGPVTCSPSRCHAGIADAKITVDPSAALPLIVAACWPSPWSFSRANFDTCLINRFAVMYCWLDKFVPRNMEDHILTKLLTVPDRRDPVQWT